MNTRHLLSSKSIIFVLILLALLLAQTGFGDMGGAQAQELPTETVAPVTATQDPTEPPTADTPTDVPTASPTVGPTDVPTEPPATDQPVAPGEESPALPATASTTHCGAINQNATWSSVDNVHVVTCDVTIAAGVTLTIDAGTIVKFDLGTSLIIDGKLTVSGTSLAPVYFTSLKDDTIGGDTNGDGASVGARGDWDRIQFNSTSDVTSMIDHAVIRFGGDSTNARGGVSLSDASPTIQNSEITQNSYCAITANLGSFPTLAGNNLHDNDANGLCLSGGNLTVTPATWNVTDTSYFLRGNVTIPLGYSLTVAPGVVVKFALDKSLIVDDKLTVSGTSGSPVYFTSLRDDTIGGDTNGDGASSGARGDWDRIQFNSTSDPTSLIDHAVIRFGGNSTNLWGGVSLSDASPSIQNSEITRNRYCAITASLGSFPTLAGNNLHANDANGLCLSGGTLWVTPATWNVTDTSYFLRGNVTIPPHRSLTVSPGVVVKFDFDASLIVNGKLTVPGTAPAPVYFTSLRDDTIGGDTNGDGSSVGTRDDWDRIQFNDTSDDTSLIDHAVIRFGGDNTHPWGGVSIGDANPTIRNTIITENAFAGLFLKNAIPTLGCNNIYSNQSYGLNNKMPGPTVPAENQWWGTASGPYHPATNPSGTGNDVSNGVDFSPWATRPCGLPAAFSKIGPPSGSQNRPVSLTLSWQTSARAASYRYCVDTSNNGVCNTSWVSAGSNTSVLISNLTLGTTYYWQVRASNAVGMTDADAGAWWSFTTQRQTANFKSVSTFDGWVLESSETSGQGGAINSTATTLQVGDNYQDKQYRSILSFSTGSLPDNAVITSAQIKVCSAGVVGINPFTTHGALLVDIRKPYFGSAASLAAADFQAQASANLVGRFGTTPSGGCYTVTLSSTGRQNVNRTGATQFRLRFQTDDNDNLGNDFIKFYSSNYSNTALRPTLIIKYYVP